MNNGGYHGPRNHRGWHQPGGYQAYYPPRFNNNIPNEVDPGMNGDGWQGSGGRGGGSHHMNGGGRRGGGGMHNQNRMPNQHHMNRGGGQGMMNFRQQQQPPQSAYIPQYPISGMPGDMMDINMRMGDMSLASTPSLPGQYGDMPQQQQQWNQPAPFADDLYDPAYGGNGNMPPQHVPFGQRGGGNQYGQRMQSNRGGYQRGGGNGGGHQNGGYMQPMMHMGGQGGGQQFYGNQQQPPFAPSPFSMGGGSQMGGGGGQDHMGGGQGGNGFQITTSSMDDYSMWTDENDEEAKRKKVLRDKGLLHWGDADVSNAKPIRKWLVPEGQEEDFEVAMARCPAHLKKKTLTEEALRRRLGSDNPQVVAQAQQQADEEANATLKIGKRPIVACGWGDLPNEFGGDKSEFDQGSSKGWGDDGGVKMHDDGINTPWNLPNVVGGPSSSETRNPFFAHHMQQQQQQQQHNHHHHQGVYGDNGDVGGSMWGMDGSAMAVNGPASAVPPTSALGMLSMGGGDEQEGGGFGQKALADSLKLAVEKGHLDISLLSLPHIPPNVLDLLTEILTVIPRLDGYEEELKRLGDLRPSNFNEKDDLETWMDKTQKNEHDKLVIGVVTSKIEVTQLSKKITEALVEIGLIAPPQGFVPGGPQQNHPNHHQRRGPGPDGGAGPSTSDGGPPDHFYDYSFLG